MILINIILWVAASVITLCVVYNQIQLQNSISEIKASISKMHSDVAILKANFLLEDPIIEVDPSIGIIVSASSLLDVAGLIQIVLCTVVQLIEMYHHQRKKADKEVAYWLFIQHTIPIASLIVYAFAYLASLVAYIGLLDSKTFFDWFTRLIVYWNTSIYLTNVTWNFLRIKKYFPSSLESWRARIVDRHFLWWAFSRTFGVDSMRNILGISIFLVTRTFLIWPFIYFFYYASSSCTATSMYSFLVNIVSHVTAIIVWTLLLNMSSYGTMSSLSRKALLVSSDVELMASLAFCGYQISMSLGRYVWLFLYGGCTWWGSIFISPMFLTIQIVAVFLSAHVVSASGIKKEFYKGLQGVIHGEQFKEKLMKEHQDEKAAELIFCDILDMATRAFMFTEKPTANDETDTAAFQRLFEIACVRHASNMDSQGDPQDPAADGDNENEDAYRDVGDDEAEGAAKKDT